MLQLSNRDLQLPSGLAFQTDNLFSMVHKGERLLLLCMRVNPLKELIGPRGAFTPSSSSFPPASQAACDRASLQKNLRWSNERLESKLKRDAIAPSGGRTRARFIIDSFKESQRVNTQQTLWPGYLIFQLLIKHIKNEKKTHLNKKKNPKHFIKEEAERFVSL